MLDRLGRGGSRGVLYEHGQNISQPSERAVVQRNRERVERFQKTRKGATDFPEREGNGRAFNLQVLALPAKVVPETDPAHLLTTT